MGGKAVFRQIEPPVQRMAVALFPRKRTHRRRQQTHRRGNFIVVGGKVHLQLHAGAAARGGYRDGIAHQKDHAVLALAGHAAPGVIRDVYKRQIVGASPETDYHILKLTEGMYHKYGLKRVFYSAYIPVAEDTRPVSYTHLKLANTRRATAGSVAMSLTG